jgi:aerobic-type carbon monoxide dehydrogenase small subunit (CoxS/CutS family)
MAGRHHITLKVNGIEYEGYAEPRKLLVDFLREDLELMGTHVGCEHGICGACTILLNGRTARSCLMFAIQANGADIKTIEGLANTTSCTHCNRHFATTTAFSAAFARPEC